ncbi:MAG: hypothetical protein KAU95_00860 [Candidatus Aenigmarchaeota archaeon]|nr:hypothetical protein [Candidatus Aenigmarchaeota archaeon]
MDKIVGGVARIFKALLIGAVMLFLIHFAILIVPGLDPLIAGYLYENDIFIIENENLEFEYKLIDEKIIMEIREKEGDGYRGIKNIKWNGSILIADAIIGATCDDPFHRIIGGYEVDGNTISLTISEKFYSSFRYACGGLYNISFKIKNLEKKDYTILLYRGEKSLRGAVQPQEINSTITLKCGHIVYETIDSIVRSDIIEETLTPQDEGYNKLFAEAMKIVGLSVDKNIDMQIPEEIKNGSISDEYVKIIFPDSLPVYLKYYDLTAEKIIIPLSGKYKYNVFIFNGKDWSVKYMESGRNRWVSLKGCVYYM